ncbi:MAG: hypothetical protein ACREBP_09785 [Sphingomicrobium sp.]
MRALLVGLAAIGTLGNPAPAQAQETTGAAFVGIPAVTVHRGFDRDHFDRRDGRRFRGNSDMVLVYDRDYQGDSLWRPNSFNDWWHERPHRAYPRWVADNQNCDRRWWSGGVWRC